MISVKSAIKQIRSNVKKTSEEIITIENSIGRVLSKKYSSNSTNPPFNVSSMDGYACRANDLKKLPKTLRIIGKSAAGKNFDGIIGKNETVRVLTGSKVPDGTDKVIIQENTSNRTDQTITIDKLNSNTFIRKKGMDFKLSDDWSKIGYPISIKNIALGSAMDIQKIKVRAKPKVAILSTGDELVSLGKKTKDFQIISSSSVALKPLIESFGASIIDLGISKDNKKSILEKINKHKNFDLIVTIGGASVGDKDLVKSSLIEKGFKMLFWKVAMRPGKPVFFGFLDKTPIIGLPGNPVSSYVCALIFVKAAIHKMLDRKDKIINEKTGIIGSKLAKNDEREDYLRARIVKKQNKQLFIYPYKRQDSSMISLLAKSDCLIKRAPFAKKLEVGDSVSFIEIP